MDIFVFGVGGLVGSNVAVKATKRGHNLTGTYHSVDPGLDVDIDTRQVDITDISRVRSLVERFDPDCVVNAAAMTNVDRCESESALAWAVNSEAPTAMAEICSETETQFIHFSTDYVFGGDRMTPYPETTERNPVQTYGETKLKAERGIATAHPSSIVLRISFVYGIHRASGELEGFPRWVLDQFDTSGPVPLFVDQQVSPTRAGQVADTTLVVSEANTSGIFHATSRTCTTPYDFGNRLQELVNAPETKIEKSTRSDVALPAERPQYTCLNVEKLESSLGRRQPTLTTDIKALTPAITDNYI